MVEIDYSVVIRTTGKAQEKYRKLLGSISKLNPQPKAVIVVLPEGYDLPEERIGSEQFEFSPKGMVIQRMHGLKVCKTRYALVCDDDVCFESDFVQKLYEPVSRDLCSFSAGPLYSFLPTKGINAIVCTVLGSASPTLLHKDRYITILKGSGYSYNRHLKMDKKYYETQSIAWTCFFADLSAIEKLNFQDEIWLDAHGYSALDDQTMFYKAWLKKMKTYIVTDAIYEHLDAKTSTRNNKPAVLYSMAFNRIVFWKRFIYEMQPNIFMKTIASVCFAYKNLMTRFYDGISILRKKMTKEDYYYTKQGTKDGKKYIKSDEYKKLQPVC